MLLPLRCTTTMNTEFTAQIIRNSADGIAGLAAARLFEQHPHDLVDDFATWKGHLRNQALQLSAALQSQSTCAFADHVTWMLVALQAQNIPASAVLKSVECLGEITSESIPTEMVTELTPYLEAAYQRFEQKEQSSQSCLAKDGPARVQALDFIAALRNGEEQEAAQAILSAHTQQGQSVQEIVEEVLSPALQEMGRLWHLGEATIAEEHFVTQATQKILAQLLAVAPQKPKNGNTAVLAGVAGERHSLGIQVVAGYLQMEGWRTVCLGSDTPPAELAGAARDFSADVILLSATMGIQIPSVIESIQQIRQLSPSTKIVVGGSAFASGNELCKLVGADKQAMDGRDAVRLANACL
jgi:methanogenic corrinoid protein MtbC1